MGGWGELCREAETVKYKLKEKNIVRIQGLRKKKKVRFIESYEAKITIKNIEKVLINVLNEIFKKN